MSTLEAFNDKFGSKEPSVKPPMTKVHAKNLIDTRMHTAYTWKQCATFRAIVDGLEVNHRDWHKVNIYEEGVICSSLAKKLAQKSSQHIDSFYRNEKRLREDGLIKVVGKGRYGQNRYTVDLTNIENMKVWEPANRKEYQRAQYLKRKDAHVEVAQ